MIYLIFACNSFYPGGGFGDLVYVGRDEAEAIAKWKALPYHDSIELYRISADYGFSVILEEYRPVESGLVFRIVLRSELVEQPHVWAEVRWEDLVNG